MSVSKRIRQKSINQSNLSSISNSQNMRDSSVFKNYALIEIQNISSHNQSKSSRKSQIEQNSLKKVVAKREPFDLRTKSKENQKYKQNRATINYSGISKIVEEKNILINTQEKQIQGLKGTLERVRKQLQLTRTQFDRKKIQDLTSLKKYQQDNQENIKELEILRVGMRQLKNKIDSLEAQKAHLSKKSHEYLSENQELTIKLTTLKQEYNTSMSTQQTIKVLTHELAVLKEQQKQTKELQLQKVSQDQRCRTLQRKINEYILRYNEIQSDYNETQIKYYRAQKDNDDLKLQVEQLEIENKNGKKMLEEEKNIMSEMMEKWKSRIIRLEDLQKTERKYPVAQIEERCAKLEQAQVEGQVQDRITEITSLKATAMKLREQLKMTKQELEKAREDNLSLSDKLRLITEQAANDNDLFHKQMIQVGASTAAISASDIENKEKIKILQKEKEIYSQQINNLEEELSQNHEYISSLELQLETLTTHTQNFEEISQASMQELDFFKQQAARLQATLANGVNEYQQLEKMLRQKGNEIDEIKLINSKLNEDIRQVTGLLKIKNAQIEEQQKRFNEVVEELHNSKAQLSDKEQEICALTSDLLSIKQERNVLLSNMEMSQLHLQTSESSLLQKLQILQQNIKQVQAKNSEQTQLIEIKNCEIARLEGIMSSTNSELKQIKTIVHNYKDQIQECNQAIVDADRRYENQLYMGKEAELKWAEEISYYKIKYEESFKQNIQLSNTMRELQKKLVDQVNKSTEQIKTIASLESQVQRSNENKSILEEAKSKEVQNLSFEYSRAKSDLAVSQSLLNQIAGQSRELELKKAEIESKLASSASEMLRIREQYNQLSVAHMRIKQQYAMTSYELLRAKEEANKANQRSTFLSQQSLRMTSQLKNQHLQQLSQLKKKFEEQKRNEAELHELKCQKLQKVHIEKQQQLNQQLLKARREIEHKDHEIQKIESIVGQKQQQLEHIQTLREVQEGEEVRKIKEYNYILVQQAQEASEQLNKNYHELREITDQCQKYRSNINLLEREVNGLQNRNIELSNQVNVLRCATYQQKQEYTRLLSELHCQINVQEQKLRNQSQQLSLWAQRCENGDKELKRIQMECNKVSRNYLDESNRKSKENTRELDNYRNQIKLLQEENFNLQRIMDKELGKRKAIIEELIHEKKMLYEQMGRN